MAEFAVYGPYEVPVYRGANGRIVREEEGRELIKAHSLLMNKRGCYLFGMRAGKGITPVYVGKATKSFRQECFTSHKLGKCNQTLVDYKKGTLVIILVAAPKGKRAPTNQIAEIEDFFIQHGVAKNPDILNVQGTKKADWSIKGVIRSGEGKPPKPSVALKSMMGI